MHDNGFIRPEWPPRTSLEELARQQGVHAVKPENYLGADLWDSEEEFQTFMANVRACRQADFA